MNDEGLVECSCGEQFQLPPEMPPEATFVCPGCGRKLQLPAYARKRYRRRLTPNDRGPGEVEVPRPRRRELPEPVARPLIDWKAESNLLAYAACALLLVGLWVLWATYFGEQAQRDKLEPMHPWLVSAVVGAGLFLFHLYYRASDWCRELGYSLVFLVGAGSALAMAIALFMTW